MVHFTDIFSISCFTQKHYRKVVRKAPWYMIILVSNAYVVAGNWVTLAVCGGNGAECFLGRGLLHFSSPSLFNTKITDLRETILNKQERGQKLEIPLR